MHRGQVRKLLPILLTALLGLTAPAALLRAQDRKFIDGFDGGMMVHSGYLKGALGPNKIPAEGAPFGLGGVVRLHLGRHLRIGGEGYVSTLKQRGNGSYLKYGWGGLLVDVYTVLGRFQPYAGVTLGGGAATTLLMDETPSESWTAIDGTLYNKQGFMALVPFIGCDFILNGPMHLTLKLDWLNALGKHVSLPAGPRLYFGFIFYH